MVLNEMEKLPSSSIRSNMDGDRVRKMDVSAKIHRQLNMSNSNERSKLKSSIASAIFEPYRALGVVSNELPFIVRYLQNAREIRIVTLTGRQFHSYSERLTLVETSALHNERITTLAADSNYVYTSSGTEIYAWRGGHKWVSDLC